MTPAATTVCQPGSDPDRPVPYTLTPKAHALLDRADLSCPVPYTLTPEAHALLDASGPAGPGPGEWSCERCRAAFFGTPPEDGLCPPCRAGQDSQ